MKHSFSTVACMDLSWPEVLSYAEKHHMEGVEIRLDREGGIFGVNRNELEELTTAFNNRGIAITNLGTNVAVRNYDQLLLQRAKECVELAEAVGASGIRIFLGSFCKYFYEYPPHNYSGIIQFLQELAEYAAKFHVEVWIETHNEFSSGKILKRLLEDCNKENIKIIWDVLHSIEVGENFFETVEYLRHSIVHVHMKDGIPSGDVNKTSYIYTRLGEGVIHPKEILEALKTIQYEGFLSLEWERAWRPELQNVYKDLDDTLYAYHNWLEGIGEITFAPNNR